MPGFSNPRLSMLAAVLLLCLYAGRNVMIGRLAGSLLYLVAYVINDCSCFLFCIVNFKNSFKSLVISSQKKLNERLYHISLFKRFSSNVDNRKVFQIFQKLLPVQVHKPLLSERIKLRKIRNGRVGIND
jgi:hypothetical protein